MLYELASALTSTAGTSSQVGSSPDPTCPGLSVARSSSTSVDVASLPADSDSQPSTGHVTGRTVRTDTEPTALVPTSRHSVGVTIGSISVQRRSDTPMTTTGAGS